MHLPRTSAIIFHALISAFGIAAAGAAEEIIRGTDEFEFVYRAKLPTITEAGRVWLPLAKTGPWQTVTIDRISSPRETRTVHDRAHQNDILVLPVSPADSGRSIEVIYFGHHPANRFELSVGRDLAVEPAPMSGPINFLVYPLLEIGGKPVKAETEFAFRRTKK